MTRKRRCLHFLSRIINLFVLNNATLLSIIILIIMKITIIGFFGLFADCKTLFLQNEDFNVKWRQVKKTKYVLSSRYAVCMCDSIDWHSKLWRLFIAFTMFCITHSHVKSFTTFGFVKNIKVKTFFNVNKYKTELYWIVLI